MKTIYRILLAVIFLIAAITSYAMGSQSGMFVFFLLGFGFEALMWLGIVGKKKVKKAQH